MGWPAFTIEAPAPTVVELMTQEAHAVGGPALLNTHFHGWSRFTCRAGVNRFETFDSESLRWRQLHVRRANGRIRISRSSLPTSMPMTCLIAARELRVDPPQAAAAVAADIRQMTSRGG